MHIPKGEESKRGGNQMKHQRKHQRRKEAHERFTVSFFVHCSFFFHPSCSLFLLSSLLFIVSSYSIPLALFLLLSFLLLSRCCWNYEILPWSLTNLRHLTITFVSYFSFIMWNNSMWLGIVFCSSSYSLAFNILKLNILTALQQAFSMTACTQW